MGFFDNVKQESSFSGASGATGLNYVVLQVTLKEKLFGTGSGNLTELEDVINKQVAKGYRLHTISTANGGSKGLGGGDRIQATMVFEKIIQLDLFIITFTKDIGDNMKEIIYLHTKLINSLLAQLDL